DIVKPEELVGESCLTGPPHYLGSAKIISAESLLIQIGKDETAAWLHDDRFFCAWFLEFLLRKHQQKTELLTDYIYSHYRGSLKGGSPMKRRLLRLLLALANTAPIQGSYRRLPGLSQATLAEMVGASRHRINAHMKELREQKCVEYSEG